ncbi:hypothetical protein FRB99_008290 [Tulasnella sp. 403]|nr:hypothetical protein FRB99_008290 [Tulasnella sp. 403]
MPPPNRVYDMLCVAVSLTDILGRAAAIQAEQLLARQATPTRWDSGEVPVPDPLNSTRSTGSQETATKDVVYRSPESTGQNLHVGHQFPPIFTFPAPHVDSAPKESSVVPPRTKPSSLSGHALRSPMPASNILDSASAGNENATPPHSDNLKSPESVHSTVRHKPTLPPLADIEVERAPVAMKASKVPSSALGRFFHYGSLAAGLTAGAATEFIRRQTSSPSANDPQSQSVMMSEANVTRLVNKLSQMRGAALKLGQFMSIQDAHVLPEQIEQILRRVQNAAHYMPQWQMEVDFDPMPIASASIGQVHQAALSPDSPFYPKTSQTHASSPEPLPLAVKVQFPGVENSIVSDIRTITLLLSGTTSLLPRGTFLDKTIEVFKEELADECNYLREAAAARRFAKELEGDTRFRVPLVIGMPESGPDGATSSTMTTARVMVMERMEGTPLGAAVKWEQEVRNEIAKNILVLCLRELFHFRFMQTDPNWSNFLYNRRTRQLELVDFGASREYSKEFIDKWYLLLKAAVEGDRAAGLEQSLALGYLIGGENETMIDAHLQSLILLGMPFSAKTPQPFDFAISDIPGQIRALIPVMLQNRLTPPPRETYSLNRKLSGAMLLCGRLKARVDCRSVWEEVVNGYNLG